ncbi:unnamed protein product [Fusarium venenatum]|uniref:Uncharacterized protein n=1 Tax=Fusarium venenatum TaxID=56646 RepID=A0A2L2TVT9_9HYPO|nr:uncharacterized protein FVRRES_10948 [Fusarium venenatum]CEI70871.1 unnamed protein product [Fusarium venenatum]
MRFDSTSILQAMAISPIADRTNCLFGACDSSERTFISEFAFMELVSSQVAKFSHQSNKRCLRMVTDVNVSCSGGWDCFRSTWKEVGCNWPEVLVPVADLATESQPAAPAKTIDNTTDSIQSRCEGQSLVPVEKFHYWMIDDRIGCSTRDKAGW